MDPRFSISHDWSAETPEAKARWFQSLTVEERIDYFCEWMDFILSINPGIIEIKHAQSIPKGARILKKT